MAELNIATRDLQLEILSKMLEKDPTGSPGPQILKAGTLRSGYFGTVAAHELISGDALALAIGLSAGIAQNSDAGWLKWAKDNKIIFVAKKTLRNTISWDQIDAVGAVFGTKTISIGEKTYKVRLLTGGDADPASTPGGEWNQIMYGAHIDEVPTWDQFSNCSLLVHGECGNGSYNWCQEASASNTDARVTRGWTGISAFQKTILSSIADKDRGWRPVLELLS